MDTCPHCSRPLGVTDGPSCPSCGLPVGFPNVRRARRPEEKAALDARYRDALDRAAPRGADGRVRAFEAALASSQAVLNVDLKGLLLLMTEGAPYLSYRQLVDDGVRFRAQGEWDRARAGVDAVLFGTYDRHIRFAALSLDGAGLPSYGAFALTLREGHIAHRASVLEENAFDFVERHKPVGRIPIPPGYIACWDERARLAVAKLADDVAPGTPDADFPAFLAWSAGDRLTDRFVEVHIFGPFDRYTVASVRGTSNGFSKRERGKLEAVKDFLAATGGTWIES